MTRTTSARVAGVTFLLYIVIAITGMVVTSGATSGEGTAAKLASIAAHGWRLRIDLVLTLAICFTALTLAVALYRITRDEDREIAALALVCRAVEGGVVPVISMFATLGLLSLGSAARANAPDAAAAYPLAELLLRVNRWTPLIGAAFFAMGSTLFSWLLLRGRMIPVGLARLGVVASILLLVGLPLELAGVLRGPATQLIWIPMAAFEVPLGVWLIVRGVAHQPGGRDELASDR